MELKITFSQALFGVDWVALKSALSADDFDNGRTPDQLRLSFENSHSFCFARAESKIVGKARVLSDGVGNAYLLDVWTQSAYRKRGIASEMIRMLKTGLPGQHLYLQADDDNVSFYTKLGFSSQPSGMSCIIGEYLNTECLEGR